MVLFIRTVYSSTDSGCPATSSTGCIAAVTADSEYLRAGLRPNCAGKFGLIALQKVVAAPGQLTYGVASDAVDEYVRIGESTARKSLSEFCKSVVSRFAWYLREPSLEDMKRIESQFSSVGFPGCIGVVDCAGWDWANYPKALQGIMVGKESIPTIRMEVIADLDLHIWHLFFGLPGMLNDINILSVSPHFADIMTGKFPQYQPKFIIAGDTICWTYYLADGIYPAFRIFIRTIPNGRTVKEKNFAEVQEAVRKCDERVFGILFQRFHILKNPGRLWDLEYMHLIMKACVILHNMIVEYRKEDYIGDGAGGLRVNVELDHGIEWAAVQTQENATGVRHGLRVRSKIEHDKLTNALVQHNWNRRGLE